MAPFRHILRCNFPLSLTANYFPLPLTPYPIVEPLSVSGRDLHGLLACIGMLDVVGHLPSEIWMASKVQLE